MLSCLISTRLTPQEQRLSFAFMVALKSLIVPCNPQAFKKYLFEGIKCQHFLPICTKFNKFIIGLVFRYLEGHVIYN